MTKPRTARKAASSNQRPRRPQAAAAQKAGLLFAFKEKIASLWRKFKDFVKRLFGKVDGAFHVKRVEDGKVMHRSWLGKWIAYPAMRVMDWVGRAVVWLARMAVYCLVAITMALAVALALAIAIACILAITVIVVAYRVIQFACLALSTPFLAYRDREDSDAVWEAYWKSWHPKYWPAMRLSDIEWLDGLYDSVLRESPPRELFTEPVMFDEVPLEEWSAA